MAARNQWRELTGLISVDLIPPCQNRADELAFAFYVGLPIAWIASGKLALQLRIGIAEHGVCPQMVAKGEMVRPELATDLGKVQVVGAWVTPPEELPLRDALGSSVDIAGPLEAADERRKVHRMVVARKDVEHGLGDETRHRSASGVLQGQLQRRQSGGYAGGLHLK